MGNRVALYSEVNYQGITKFLDLGTYDTPTLGVRQDQALMNPSLANQISIGNDGLSSVRVPAGMKVVLCEHTNLIAGLLSPIALSDLDEQAAEAIMDALPEEFFGENGPTGPNRKSAWSGPE
jgi:hypothetical protein